MIYIILINTKISIETFKYQICLDSKLLKILPEKEIVKEKTVFFSQLIISERRKTYFFTDINDYTDRHTRIEQFYFMFFKLVGNRPFLTKHIACL